MHTHAAERRERSTSKSRREIFRTLLLVVLGSLTMALTGCGDRSGHDAADPGDDAADGGRRTRELDEFGADQAEPYVIADGVYQAHGVGNTNVVVTSEGAVVIDGGLPTSASDHHALLAEVAPGSARYAIATHAHADHAGGLRAWIDDDTVVVTHRSFLETQRYLTSLIPFFMERNKIYYPDSVPDVPMALAGPVFSRLYPRLAPTVLVDDVFAFELGGTRFEVIHTPGAEGEDSISVWLPERKILFTGDFFGPIFPMWPNLYTIRGEKTRFAIPYVDSLERVLALEPEIIVPSHFLPIVGRDEIREGVTRMRDAVRYVHEATIDGMNDGKDVYTLMDEIQLPPELQLSEAHGKVAWGVRAIWEGYAGWFHHETPQLYSVPPRSVWGEVVEMSGGPADVAARARARLEAGEPVQALHLTAMALEADPASTAALQVELGALEELQRRAGGVNHSEVMWLRHRIEETREALGG